MARRPMMAANWKMNKTVREAEEYTAALLPRAADAEEDVDVVVCAPHTCLYEVGRMAGDSAVIAGAHTFPIDRDKVPGCTYTDPEVASIGLTEAKAKERAVVALMRAVGGRRGR